MASSTDFHTEPLNREIPRLFVAATRQNEGKTTTSLGLFAALQTVYPKVGYIKPIGQRFIDIEGMKIDEDSYLFDKIYNLEVPIQSMSPVAIDSTFTRRYLKNPDEIHPTLVDKIVRAFDRATFGKQAVIVEGSGHAGVGAICDLSNAQVAKLLGAKAIIVARGGIGMPVDEIALNKSLFDKEGVEVVGAIINKVKHDKIDVIEEYTRKGLERLGVPLLGVMPEQEQLSKPNLSQVAEELNGRWINGDPEDAHPRLKKIVVGAMSARGFIEQYGAGALIITPGDRDDILLSMIASAAVVDQTPASGLVLTSNTLPHPKLMELLAKTNMPVIITEADSYTTASKINRMTVKTQPEDQDKIPLIKRMILENVDLDKILNAFR
jgi:BioD-like phosphotransacetylase family protein|tara:strand:+ start:4895 stop:6034 length:1140 start_codon:yes stop_codon:yes gene_type:complete